MATFEAWPKTPRLYRNCVITEKIDGTNACVVVEQKQAGEYASSPEDLPDSILAVVPGDNEEYWVSAQSRNRMLALDSDNFNFAQWVKLNGEALATTLGPGRHFGEWWGSGIQRGYGLTKGEKRFSLFNTARFDGLRHEFDLLVPGLEVVPILVQRTFSSELVNECLSRLREEGSLASPGFMNPEGACIFHTASRQVYKVTLDNDGQPKSTVGIK